jgi:hypothetical protein
LIIALEFLQNSLGRGSSSLLERVSLSLEIYFGEEDALVFIFFFVFLYHKECVLGNIGKELLAC